MFTTEVTDSLLKYAGAKWTLTLQLKNMSLSIIQDQYKLGLYKKFKQIFLLLLLVLIFQYFSKK